MRLQARLWFLSSTAAFEDVHFAEGCCHSLVSATRKEKVLWFAYEWRALWSIEDFRYFFVRYTLVALESTLLELRLVLCGRWSMTTSSVQFSSEIGTWLVSRGLSF